MKKYRSSIALILMILAVVGLRVHAAVNIPLTIQEAIYPGSIGGLTRTADPVTVGIPLPDDPATGATDVSQLTLTGVNAGQFRVLGRWPSGRIKWVLVDTLASLSAGTQTGIGLTSGGSGNFGGSDLATDNGATITVSTGSATFTIRKANFNGIDQVVVGGTTVVSSGTSQGLVVTGPPPGGTTCGTCTTAYSSANDGSSTAIIEENGPVKTVIKATGSHKDTSGNPYMKFTVRLYFFKGKSAVKATVSLRNADLGGSGSIAAAYKGLAAYEWRTTANIGGTTTYDMGKHGGGVETGSLAGADEVYLYQGQSQSMVDPEWCGGECVAYTTDSGYAIRKNGASLANGSNTEYPAGWADIRNSSGAGISIGVYQMAAYWPKSLEFASGGSQVRVGIWPRQNSRTYHQAWPQWSTHDLYLNFHAAALASPANEFLKFQHYLIARASYTHYNATGVFPYPMIDPGEEQNYYLAAGASAVPTLSASRAWPYLDKGTADTANWNLPVIRYKNWQAGGGGNQAEFRWAYLMNWITRGMTGRYLAAAHFYRYQTDDVFPHSDGFAWKDQTSLIDLFGRPANVGSLNDSLAFRNWIDQEHSHWYGMGDYYFMSGDELAREQLLDGVMDWFTATGRYQSDLALLYDTRAVGGLLLGAARYATFLRAIGDTAGATAVLDNATKVYDAQVKTELCPVSDAPYTGCTPNPGSPTYFDNAPNGVSRLRGIHWGDQGFLQNYCGVGNLTRRFSSILMSGILINGILEFRDAKGSGWGDYLNSLDLAYGISQGSLGESTSETWYDNGNGRWDQNGPRAFSLVDVESDCPSGVDDQSYEVGARQTHWMHFYVKYLVEGSTSKWRQKFNISLQKLMAALGVNWHEMGSYLVSPLIKVVNAPGPTILNAVPITGVTDNGGGSYTIRWTVPANTQSYRIKYGPKQIVDWIGFDVESYAFVGNPSATMNWFAATNVPTLPAPAAAGTTQNITISTGRTGLTAANFSVKAYVGGGGGTTPPPPVTASTLTLVSGDNQTGTAGSPLSAPFTVKVTDGNGNPVAGVNVAFAVMAGGGTLSGALVATNGSGFASTTLTLGSAGGTNTVSASSGTLTGSPITLTATALSAGAIPISPNTWMNVSPGYQGAPNGGAIAPMTYNNMGVYDPVSKRTISFERWYDPIRSMSIYANGLLAYDPATNTTTVLKLTNWSQGNQPLPSNTTDPTPIDRHPLGGLALVPSAGAVYLVNGANQTGRLYYPDHPNDTWKFSLGSGTWTKIADASTSAGHPPSDTGSYSGMVHDPQTGKVAYFVSVYPYGTRTYLLDPSSNQWSVLSADPSSANVYISAAGIAYDSRRNLVLAYAGGYHSDSGDSPKLWAYSVSQNKWTALPDAPIAATAPEFAYDSVHDIFLAVAGQRTLIYNPRTRTWSQLAATLDRGIYLNRQNVTYNPAQDVFVFQGGTTERPVWSLFRYSDAGSPSLPVPTAPTNIRIVR
jgi:hypothetical protein